MNKKFHYFDEIISLTRLQIYNVKYGLSFKLIFLLCLGSCLLNLQGLAAKSTRGASKKVAKPSAKLLKPVKPLVNQSKLDNVSSSYSPAANPSLIPAPTQSNPVFYSAPIPSISESHSVNLSPVVTSPKVQKSTEVGIGERKMPKIRYGGAMAVSTFIGFGLGSYMEGDRAGLIAFSIIDSVFLLATVGVGLMHYLAVDDPIPDPKDPTANQNIKTGPKHILRLSLIGVGALYGLLRLIEIIYNAVYPFSSSRAIDGDKTVASSASHIKDYRGSRLSFVLNKMPTPFTTGKGGGLVYAYTFKN